jgi:phage baseplate assembly protein W
MPVYKLRSTRARLASQDTLRRDFSESILDPDYRPTDIEQLEDSEYIPSLKSFGPSFPFGPGDTSVLESVTTFEEEIYQNVQSLLLSSPGDCLSDDEFGVGIRNFLFSLENDQTVKSVIVDNIRQQMAKYYPAINIKRLDFFDEGERKRVALTVSLSSYITTITV